MVLGLSFALFKNISMAFKIYNFLDQADGLSSTLWEKLVLFFQKLGHFFSFHRHLDEHQLTKKILQAFYPIGHSGLKDFSDNSLISCFLRRQNGALIFVQILSIFPIVIREDLQMMTSHLVH